MLEPVSLHDTDIENEIDEHAPLLPIHRAPLNVSGHAPQDTTQSVVNWFKNYVTPVTMPILYALNGSAISSTIITLSAGWPKKVPKVIAPAIYIGLPFNAIGFLDALATEYKINRLNKFRHGYRVLINGTNTALFSLQLLIAILDDIYQTRNKPFDVSNAAFAGICVGPAVLGLITILVQGFNVQRPSDLKSLKNKIRYALLALLDLTNNASTAHSFIQDMAALTNPLTSPSGMLFRYSLALAPGLAAESVKISEHLPESWFSSCMLNCPRSFLTYLRSSPEQLFLIISALNYAIFNEEVMRNNEKDFSVTGATLTILFWFYVVLLPIVVRFYGGLSPSPERQVNFNNEAHPFGVYYDSDEENLLMQDGQSTDDDLEAGSPAYQPDQPDAPLVRQEVRRDAWIQELPFAADDFAALVEYSQQQANPQQGASVATGAQAGPPQPGSHDDLHAAPATGSAQQPPAASAVLAVEPLRQLPVVANDLPLAPNSAKLSRRLSLQAEIQRSAAMQQPADAQQLRRAQSSELMVATEAAKELNNPLR